MGLAQRTSPKQVPNQSFWLGSCPCLMGWHLIMWQCLGADRPDSSRLATVLVTKCISVGTTPSGSTEPPGVHSWAYRWLGIVVMTDTGWFGLAQKPLLRPYFLSPKGFGQCVVFICASVSCLFIDTSDLRTFSRFGTLG